MHKKWFNVGLIAVFFVVSIGGVLFILYLEDRQNAMRRQGYCTWIKEKKGILLSEEHRLNLAVEAYLGNQESIDYREIELYEGGGKRDRSLYRKIKESYSLLPYRDMDDFLYKNNKCCSVVGVDIPYPSGDLFDFLSNVGDSVFEIKHRIIFSDNSGYIREIESDRTYFSVDNCGVVELIFRI